jgi:Peptidase A4 family
MSKRKKFPHGRAVAALGSAAAILVAGSLALDTAGASAQTINAQQQNSQNWSGYVVNSQAGHSFSNVSGSWVEPSVNASSNDGYAAFWVGIGGASNQSQALEQVGTAAQTVNGKVSYYAWYELVPSAQVPLNMTIHPGDHISAKVGVNGTSVTISITDQTTGQSVTKTLQMSNPDTSSAEWIAEAPAAVQSDGSMQILPLADFGKVTFTQASATAGGHTGSISDPAWTPQQIDLSSAGSQQFLDGGPSFTSAGLGGASQSTAGASAGNVSSDGSSFSVAYNADGSGSQSSSATSTSASGAPGGYVDPSGYVNPNAYGYPGGNGGYGYPGSGGYAYPGYAYSGGGYIIYFQ